MGLSVDDQAALGRVLAVGSGRTLCSSLAPFFGGSCIVPDDETVDVGDPAVDPRTAPPEYGSVLAGELRCDPVSSGLVLGVDPRDGVLNGMVLSPEGVLSGDLKPCDRDLLEDTLD